MEWQPIETAPRNGTEFLAATQYTYSGPWVKQVVHWRGGKLVFSSNLRPLEHWPSYWQPLPDDPKVTA